MLTFITAKDCTVEEWLGFIDALLGTLA